MNKMRRSHYKNMAIIYRLWQAIECAAAKPFGCRSSSGHYGRFLCALVLFLMLCVASIGAGEKRPVVDEDGDIAV
ncbi:MAG: hypothetical protein ACOCWJ_05505, partial [Verrucomicrobiota bacterium]